jgi:hypothetical protein
MYPDMRSWRRSICVLLFGMTFPAVVFAQHGRLALHAHGGYSFPESGYLHGEFESGFGVSYPILGGRLSLSIEFSHWTSLSNRAKGVLYNGTVSASPIIICLQGEFLQNPFFIPCAFAGGAFVFTRFSIGSYASIPEVRIDQQIADGPAFYFGLGARIPLNSTLNFFSEGSYLMRSAPGKTTYRDMNQGVSSADFRVNLRTVFLKFGLKLFF